MDRWKSEIANIYGLIPRYDVLVKCVLLLRQLLQAKDCQLIKRNCL